MRVIPLEKCITVADIEKNKTRFECTLLHELVHFVRKSAGLMDTDWDKFPDFPMEAGDQFEMWAYRVRTCSDTELSDALASYL